MLAAIRPDDVNLPLFLHVLGAMLLVGVLLTVVVSLAMAGRDGGDTGLRFTRLGLKALLLAAFPAYLLMRIGAQWTESQEDLPPAVEDQVWIGIGYIVADAGALFLIVTMVLSWLSLRKLDAGGGRGQARAVSIISVLLLVAYVVAVWAMTTKPE